MARNCTCRHFPNAASARERELTGHGHWPQVRMGGKLASCGDAGIRIWDLESMTSVGLPPGAAGERISICFAPDNNALLASYRASGLHRWPLHRIDGNLQLGAREPLGDAAAHAMFAHRYQPGWPAARPLLSGKRLCFARARAARRGHPASICMAIRMPSMLVISPNGQWVASGTRTNGGVQVWNAASGEAACDLEANFESRPLFFSPDSKWLLTGSARGYQFWKVGTWEKGPRIEPESGDPLSSFSSAFSPKGDLLAVPAERGSDCAARLTRRDPTCDLGSAACDHDGIPTIYRRRPAPGCPRRKSGSPALGYSCSPPGAPGAPTRLGRPVADSR